MSLNLNGILVLLFFAFGASSAHAGPGAVEINHATALAGIDA